MRWLFIDVAKLAARVNGCDDTDEYINIYYIIISTKILERINLF